MKNAGLHGFYMLQTKTFVKRYVKSGNYLAIKEPALAADLLAKFNEKFITK